jgi:hypothetical protein
MYANNRIEFDVIGDYVGMYMIFHNNLRNQST